MVFEHEGEHAWQWAAIRSIAATSGGTAETLPGWVRQAERDQGRRAGPTTEERERLQALEREVRELRQANELLRQAAASFAQAARDRRFQPGSPSSTLTAPSTGSSRSAGSCADRPVA